MYEGPPSASYVRDLWNIWLWPTENLLSPLSLSLLVSVLLSSEDDSHSEEDMERILASIRGGGGGGRGDGELCGHSALRSHMARIQRGLSRDGSGLSMSLRDSPSTSEELPEPGEGEQAVSAGGDHHAFDTGVFGSTL